MRWLPPSLAIPYIFIWDRFMNDGDTLKRIEQVTCDLCFGYPLSSQLQKQVGHDRTRKGA